MLVSLKWLKEYVDFGDKSVEEMSALLTGLGLEVDGVDYVIEEESENIVVGYVESSKKHPDADKLNLCQVDVGEEENLQIVCGAANVAAGQKVVVAKPGAVLPGNFKIKQVKLRGIESNGMICSLQELSVNEKFISPNDVDGIMVLPDEAEVGKPVDELLNLDDVVLDIDLTPNRADALSMLGVAYDVSAVTGAPVKYPEISLNPSSEKARDYIHVRVEDAKLAPYYAAFILKDIKVKESPLWMQNRLLAAGIRPINNVVDITNYVLIEYGQPLHAFDYDLIESNEILVRRAQKEEEIRTLDGVCRQLTDEIVITNGQKPIALAGVMGGEKTEVSESTTTVLLEAAYFDAASIRKAVNKTGLRSEASTRFEKGVDPARVKEASERAAQLLVEYADATLLSDLSEFNEVDLTEKEIKLSPAAVNARLGTSIETDEVKSILTKLQFNYVQDGDVLHVKIPTRRNDLTIFEDMVEEIARIYGYDKIPYTLPKNASSPGRLSKEQLLKRRIKNYLQGVGLSEAITYSLVDKEQTNQLLSPEIKAENYLPVPLAMPLSEDHKYLRLSQLPELLNRLSHNVARKQANVFLYEVGSIFLNKESEIKHQPHEQLRVSGALTGNWLDHKWQNEVKKVDFYLVKGIIEGLADYLSIEIKFEQATLDDLHPGRAANLLLNDEIIGFMGQVHPLLTKEKDLKETFVFDLDLERLLNLEREALIYQPIPQYPSILRDVAFVVDKNVEAATIKQTLVEKGQPLVKKVEAFDVYTGEGLASHEKSIAFNLHYQDSEKTLTDKEVDASFKALIEEVKTKHKAYVRS